MKSESRPGIGLVVPPANTAVEDEYSAYCSDVFRISATRYGVHPGVELRQRLDRYATELPGRIASFGAMPLHAVVACCSGNHYLAGHAADLAHCRAASEERGGLVVSTTVAVVAWLRRQQTESVVIASPYHDWLTELSLAYWRSAGIEVTEVTPVVLRDGNHAASPYDLTAADIVASVDAARDRESPVLFVGTGMHTQDAMSTMSTRDAGRRFYSSNSCGAAWLRDTAELADPLVHL